MSSLQRRPACSGALPRAGCVAANRSRDVPRAARAHVPAASGRDIARRAVLTARASLRFGKTFIPE
jgi:hypothetical protein